MDKDFMSMIADALLASMTDEDLDAAEPLYSEGITRTLQKIEGERNEETVAGYQMLLNGYIEARRAVYNERDRRAALKTADLNAELADLLKKENGES